MPAADVVALVQVVQPDRPLRQRRQDETRTQDGDDDLPGLARIVSLYQLFMSYLFVKCITECLNDRSYYY